MISLTCNVTLAMVRMYIDKKTFCRLYPVSRVYNHGNTCMLDILLLSSSCHGLQSTMHNCSELGKRWDCHFNPAKTQCVTFGGQATRQFNPIISGNFLIWSSKLKYLGCTIRSGSCESDIASAVGKFQEPICTIFGTVERHGILNMLVIVNAL